MKICFFGSYDPLYSRNKILIDGLKKNGVSVVHCRSIHGSFLTRYLELSRCYWNMRQQIDIIFVAFVGHLNIPLAWLLAKLTGKKIVFDMFYSMFDTYVHDRRSAKPGSLRARLYLWIDKIATAFSDIVITDTQAHANYFIELLGSKKQKFKRIFVGGDDTLFKPINKKQHSKVIVEFHGMFTRLQGAEYFIQAAKLLEKEINLEFWLIGSSSHYHDPITLYKRLNPLNMKYFGELSVKKLAQRVARADISIGHLGNTKKARSVITNKIFHALAVKTAVIVGDSPAVRELLQDKVTALFTNMADSVDLAEKIKYLAKNWHLRLQLAQNGHQLFKEKLTNMHIAQTALKIFKPLLS